MERWLKKDSEIDYWMTPYSGVVLCPAYQRQRRESTRLWFEFYWQLRAMGYSEGQLVDFALRVRRYVFDHPLPDEVAFDRAVYTLAENNGLCVPVGGFVPVLERQHPGERCG